jgi:hypothetical protein
MINIVVIISMTASFPLMALLRATNDMPAARMANIIFIFQPIFLEMATCSHQRLRALAFFLFAASCFLVRDIPGRQNTTSGGTAVLLPFIGFTKRNEHRMAFSWLAITQRADLKVNLPSYILRRVISLPAFAIFLIFFHYVVTVRAGC